MTDAERRTLSLRLEGVTGVAGGVLEALPQGAMSGGFGEERGSADTPDPLSEEPLTSRVLRITAGYANDPIVCTDYRFSLKSSFLTKKELFAIISNCKKNSLVV